MKILPANWHSLRTLKTQMRTVTSFGSIFIFMHLFWKKVISLGILLIIIYVFPSMRTLRKGEFLNAKDPLLTRNFHVHIYILVKISFIYENRNVFLKLLETCQVFTLEREWNDAKIEMFKNTSWHFFIDKGNQLGINSFLFHLLGTVGFNKPRMASLFCFKSSVSREYSL